MYQLDVTEAGMRCGSSLSIEAFTAENGDTGTRDSCCYRTVETEVIPSDFHTVIPFAPSD